MATSRIDNKTPFMATHPYDIVKDEMKARSMTQKELAARMGVEQSNLSRMLKSKSAVSQETAERLEKALEIPAETWLGLQAQYNKDVKAIEARDENEKMAYETEKMLSAVLNLEELYSRLKISTSLFIQEKLGRLKSLMGMDVMDVTRLMSVCNGDFKKSDKLAVDERNNATWVVLAYIASRQNLPCEPYKKGNARIAAEKIARMTHDGTVTEKAMTEVLNGLGIGYSVVKKLDKTPVDGFSVLVDGHPAIVTTHRHNDMSMLIFNVLHELGHIELHLKDKNGMSYLTTKYVYSSMDDKEIEANDFAKKMLIPDETWGRMMSDVSVKSIWSSDIVNVLKKQAKRFGVDFNIVIWRYKYETKRYALRGVRMKQIV